MEPREFWQIHVPSTVCEFCAQVLAKPNACEQWRYRQLRKELATDGLVLSRNGGQYILVRPGPLDRRYRDWRDLDLIAGPCDLLDIEAYVLRSLWQPVPVPRPSTVLNAEGKYVPITQEMENQ